MNIDRNLGSLLSDCVFEMERQVPYAAALAMERDGERFVLRNKSRIVEEVEPAKGAVFTVFTGKVFLEASVNDLTAKSMKDACRRLVEAARYEGIRYDGPEVDPGPSLKERFATTVEIRPEDLGLEEKMQALEETHARLNALDPNTADAVIQYGHVAVKELFVNRTKSLEQSLSRTQAVALLILRDENRSVSLHAGHCRQGGWEHASMDDSELTSLAEDCRLQLGAERLDPGFHDVIFSPEFAGIFAHEAFGHGMEADMFLKKRAMGEAYMGKETASPLVDMFDDPSLPGQAASYFFDHEGCLSAPTRLINKGVLCGALTDLNSALRLNLPRTANGRRESYERKVYARMSNTFFGTGNDTLANMLSDIEEGYLLDRPSNGMEDPKGWGIQLEGYLAREIRHGKLTGRVKSPVIVTGTVPDLLKSITMVGDRIEISGLGMCGKGHKEWVKVTDGGPYLRLRARLG